MILKAELEISVRKEDYEVKRTKVTTKGTTKGKKHLLLHSEHVATSVNDTKISDNKIDTGCGCNLKVNSSHSERTTTIRLITVRSTNLRSS